MLVKTNDVAKVGRALLDKNPINGVGKMLQNLALQESRKHNKEFETDNDCIIAIMNRAKISVDSVLQFYG